MPDPTPSARTSRPAAAPRPGALGLGRADFPPGFVFGAATSAYQIEGHRFGGAGPTHWDSFAATPGNVAGAADGAVACDHYHRWAEDLDLAAAAGFDAWRFSTSWARVLPEGRGAPNPEGLDFYDRLVDGMLARGLKPCLTLHHWELPSALADLGGWQNRDIAARFAEFARLMARRLGDRLHSLATLNEPWCIAWLAHFLGVHAPGLRDIRAAARAMHHTCLAHGLALAALRAEGQGNLGLVLNFEHVDPASAEPADAAAAEVEDALFNRWFVEAAMRGTYPAPALAGLAPHLPDGWQDDMATISAPLDWLGVNYYTRRLVAAAPGTPFPASRALPGPLPRTATGWEIFPEGLQHLLIRLARTVTGDLPLIVTENGIALDDSPRDGRIEDADRIAFIAAHLRAVRAAIAAGAPVGGYFCWSALDNFEWALGYAPRFGLVHVDFATLERRPKASWHAMAEALRR